MRLVAVRIGGGQHVIVIVRARPGGRRRGGQQEVRQVWVVAAQEPRTPSSEEFVRIAQAGPEVVRIEGIGRPQVGGTVVCPERIGPMVERGLADEPRTVASPGEPPRRPL